MNQFLSSQKPFGDPKNASFFLSFLGSHSKIFWDTSAQSSLSLREGWWAYKRVCSTVFHCSSSRSSGTKGQTPFARRGWATERCWKSKVCPNRGACALSRLRVRVIFRVCPNNRNIRTFIYWTKFFGLVELRISRAYAVIGKRLFFRESNSSPKSNFRKGRSMYEHDVRCTL